MHDAHRQHLQIALNAARGLGRASACRLAAEPELWLPRTERPLDDVAAELGVTSKALRRGHEIAADPEPLASRELERAHALGAHVVTRDDPEYPAALEDLSLPPSVLYVRGAIPSAPAVAMVGSRRCDRNGREAAELFARALAEAGVTVVSGFARGIDAAAHRGALASRAPGATVAILGCGLGVDYPKGHRKLGEEVVENGGAVLSELPCATPPRPWHFPVRNRLIAALSAGTLVVQATHRSGSLITARHALELGRDVWAVPGGLFDEKALGTNTLIRDGAPLVLHPKDILEALRLDSGTPRRRLRPGDQEIQDDEPAEEPVEGFEGRVLAALPPGKARPAEDLARALQEPLDRILGALLELELIGRARREPGPVYRRSSP